MLDTKAQWEQDKAEDIEAYNVYMDRERRREAGEPVSDDEDDDGEEEGKPKTAPTKPVFDEDEALAKFDEKEENAIVEIPDEIVDDIDDDWPMNADEENEYVDRVLASREAV